MGIFIKIETIEAQITPELSSQLARLCPVDIFEAVEGRLIIKPDREDECTLCNLCLQSAPVGVLRIHKLYNDEIMLSTGGE